MYLPKKKKKRGGGGAPLISPCPPFPEASAFYVLNIFVIDSC